MPSSYPKVRPPDSVQKLYGGKSTLVRGTQRNQLTFSFGAVFVEVRDQSAQPARSACLVSSAPSQPGRIMNTRTARSQLMSGLIWGMSAALLESTEFDTLAARTVNRDLQDYHIPVNADVQDVQVIMLPETDNFVNPAGRQRPRRTR